MPHIYRFERNVSMKDLYAKMTFRLVLISFLALMLIGCGESGSSGGASGPGVTAAINLDVIKGPTGVTDGITESSLSEAPIEELPADGKSSAAIRVRLADSAGDPVMMGTKLKLHTNLGSFRNGKQDYLIEVIETAEQEELRQVSDSYMVRRTETAVIIVTSIMAGTTPGTAEIWAESNNITQRTEIEFTSIEKPTPAKLSLGASGNAVKTDNSDNVTITAVVLDASSAPVKDIAVQFKSTAGDGSSGGSISASNVMTDDQGIAEIIFSSGVGDKRNQVVTIEATVDGIGTKQIPIQVTGSYLTVQNQGETLLNLGGSSSTLKVVVRDAGDEPVFDVPVTLSLGDDSTGAMNFDPATGKTDINGEFLSVLTGTAMGTAVVNVESIGAFGSQTYKVDDPDKEFRISTPQEEVNFMTTDATQTVQVMARGYGEVTFATTLGAWDGTDKKIVKKSVSDGMATAIFNSEDAGTATLQVYPTDSPSIIDTVRIAVAAPSSEASKVFFQTSATVIPASIGDAKNSVTLIAEVTNAKNQVVSGAPVLFSIVSPTGGGEYVSPAIAFTDASGIATSVFTSGSLVAGADGVVVKAELINIDASDTVSIRISGQALSLAIGRSTEVLTDYEETMYQLPMTVLVTDANGSPVQQTQVSLNLWPSDYRTGFWQPTQNNNEECIPIVEGSRPNEDVNKNGINDEGEDINLDGQLTPASSAAGQVPATLTTDENGVASFYIIYPKTSACWIVDELSASTVVSGTETRSTYRFVLPWSIPDADACLLPDSPYFFEPEVPEAGSITVSTGATAIVADGTSKAVIRAIVNDTDGGSMSGVTVNFSTTLGTFNNFSTATAVTGDSGVAILPLQAGMSPGIATVTAEAAGFTDQVEVEFTAGGTQTLILEALPPKVAPGGTSSISAIARDQFGNPVSDEELFFNIYENNTGGSIGPTCSCPTCLTTTTTATTDVNGRAIVYYCAGYQDVDGCSICTCEGDKIRVTLATNSSIIDEICVDWGVPNGEPGYIIMSADPEAIPFDGITSTKITVQVFDTVGAPLFIDAQVSFTALDEGRFLNGSLHTADETGTIILSWMAPVKADTVESARIKATCYGLTQLLTIGNANYEDPEAPEGIVETPFEE